MNQPKRGISKDQREAVEAMARGGAKSLGVVIPPELAPPAEPRKNKYGAKPTVYNGIRFDSKAEAARAQELDGWKDGPAPIRYLRQPRFTLGVPENVYVADFLVWDWRGKVHAEDVKGMLTPKFRRDLKLWKRYGPCQLWIITGKKIEHVNGGDDPECLRYGTAGNSTIEDLLEADHP